MNIASKEMRKLKEQGTGLTSTGELINSTFLFISKQTMKKIKEQRNGITFNRSRQNATTCSDFDDACMGHISDIEETEA